MSKSLRIVFAGTPAFALPSLEALFQTNHEIVAVYTQPDRPAGRGQKLQTSIIKQWAVEHHLPVYQPLSLRNDEAYKELESLQPDVMIVVAYGLILPQSILSIPKFGCINVHGSLLPRWRGAAPVQYAIHAGDKQTGVTIMQMDVGMDTGDMLTQVSTPITDEDTSESVLHRLSYMAQQPLLETLEHIDDLKPIKQDEAFVTYAPKINKTDAKINWQQTAKEIHQQIRAYYPWPIAFTQFDSQDIKIHQASIIHQSSNKAPGTIVTINKQSIQVVCGEDILAIQEWQWPNSKKMSVQSFLNGQNCPIQIGQQFL